ncbi:MAG: PAC2 family protein [Candidatus Methanospirareceae archaeon]
MSGLKSEGFKIEEFYCHWEVDEEDFKAGMRDRVNILIAGFPPMGNIIPYHLKELLTDSEKVVSFYSYDFPPMVEVRDEEFEIPHDELWYSAEKSLFCYVGKYPEVEYIPKSAYKQAEGVAQLARTLNVKELYTIGVILPSQEPFRREKEEVEAYIGCFEGSKKEMPRGTKKMTRRTVGRYTIIRKTGLLPGFASKLGIESYSILGVGSYPEDLRACARALRAFKQLSGAVIEETAKIEETLERSAESFEARIREQQKRVAYRGEGLGAEPNEYMYG